jgi:hypothetical protein
MTADQITHVKEALSKIFTVYVWLAVRRSVNQSGLDMLKKQNGLTATAPKKKVVRAAVVAATASDGDEEDEEDV